MPERSRIFEPSGTVGRRGVAVASKRTRFPGWKRALPSIILVVATLAVYAPSVFNKYVWDDDRYVYGNALIQRWDGLKEIWFSFQTPQYYPMVFTSYWVEHKVWGFDPTGYHAVNVLLHALNALLVYGVLLRLWRRVAFPAALLFALHPIQVETVAWITERKNLLGALFFFLAILAYLKFMDFGTRRHYWIALLAFAAALLSKSVTVCFVLVPFFVPWWRGERIGLREGFLALPFVGLGLAAGVNTVVLEMYHVGAMGGRWDLSFFEHVILAGKIIFFYLEKFLIPHGLMFFYPRWENDPRAFVEWLPLAFVIGVLVLLYAYRREVGRGGLALYLFFILSLAPALGVFRVFPMMYSWVADHFTYVSSAAIITLYVAAAQFVCDRWGPWGQRITMRSGAGYGALAAIAVVFGFQVVELSRNYENAQILWTDLAEKNPTTWAAPLNLGLIYWRQGRLKKAALEFQTANRLDRNQVQGHTDLGAVYLAMGRRKEARSELETAILIEPRYAKAHNNLGLLSRAEGDRDKALEQFAMAVRYDPDLAAAQLNLATEYLEKGMYALAVPHFLRATKLQPDAAAAFHGLARAYDKLGEAGPASQAYREAIRLYGKVLRAGGQVPPDIEETLRTGQTPGGD